jgi:hypothetical protein
VPKVEVEVEVEVEPESERSESVDCAPTGDAKSATDPKIDAMAFRDKIMEGIVRPWVRTPDRTRSSGIAGFASSTKRFRAKVPAQALHRPGIFDTEAVGRSPSVASADQEAFASIMLTAA